MKNLISQYGVLIVTAVVIALIIAFASPLGNNVINGIKEMVVGIDDAGDRVTTVAGYTQLDAPTNLRLEGNILTFDSVPNATEYRIVVSGGNSVMTDATAVDLTELISNVSGRCNIYVTARGDWAKFKESSAGRYEICGWFKDGKLVKTWQELLDEGLILMESEGEIEGYSDDLYGGELVIPSDGSVSTIYGEAFDGIGVSTIDISGNVIVQGGAIHDSCDVNTIKFGRDVVIAGSIASGCTCSIENIIYEGTKEEWDSVVLSPWWSEGLAMCPTTLTCSDGEYEIPGVYDDRGDLQLSWADLITNDLIEIDGETLVFVDWETSQNYYSIVVPGSIKVIEAYAFDWSYFHEIKLSSGTTTIISQAFNDCCELERLYIPKTVTSAGDWGGCLCCEYPLEIIYEGTVAEWNDLGAPIWDPMFVTCNDGTVYSSAVGDWKLNDVLDLTTLPDSINVEIVYNGNTYTQLAKTTVGSSSWGIYGINLYSSGDSSGTLYAHNPGGSYGISHGWYVEPCVFTILTNDVDLLAWLVNNAVRQ